MHDKSKFTSREFLILSLPEWKRTFVDTQAFKILEIAFHDWLESKENIQEKREILKLANENFQHLCDTDPSGEKEKYLQKIQREKKQMVLDKLYLQHKEQMI